MTDRGLRILSPVAAANYGAAAIVGAFAAGVSFILLAALNRWEPFFIRDAALPAVAAGAILACAMTFLCRRVIETFNHRAPMHFALNGPPSTYAKAAATVIVAACAAVALTVLYLERDGGIVKAAGSGCETLHRC